MRTAFGYERRLWRCWFCRDKRPRSERTGQTEDESVWARSWSSRYRFASTQILFDSVRTALRIRGLHDTFERFANESAGNTWTQGQGKLANKRALVTGAGTGSADAGAGAVGICGHPGRRARANPR